MKKLSESLSRFSDSFFYLCKGLTPLWLKLFGKPYMVLEFSAGFDPDGVLSGFVYTYEG